jgi:Na+-transporting methylmalonyl-CoA/oxaloacetate decarboxylase gamma subunit
MILILVILIIVAYFIGRFVQWTADAKRVMGPWNGRR